MTKRTAAIAFVVAVAAALYYFLISHAGLTWNDVTRAIDGVGLSGFLMVLALTGLNLALGTVKWLVVLRTVAPEYGVRPRFADSMLTTTAGALLGQVMPVQVGVSLTRSIAGRFGVGSSPTVNFGTTAYEQLFDAAILCIAASIGGIALLIAPGPGGWLLIVGFICTLVGFALGLLRRGLTALPRSVWLQRHATGFVGKLVLAAVRAAQFPPAIVGQLFVLSLLRYVVVLLRAAIVLGAIGLWSAIAPAVLFFPVVQFIGFLPITPGNLGVLESTWVGLLVYAGAAFNAAVLFSITVRIVNLMAQMMVFGLCLLVRLLPRPSVV